MKPFVDDPCFWPRYAFRQGAELFGCQIRVSEVLRDFQHDKRLTAIDDFLCKHSCGRTGLDAQHGFADYAEWTVASRQSALTGPSTGPIEGPKDMGRAAQGVCVTFGHLLCREYRLEDETDGTGGTLVRLPRRFQGRSSATSKEEQEAHLARKQGKNEDDLDLDQLLEIQGFERTSTNPDRHDAKPKQASYDLEAAEHWLDSTQMPNEWAARDTEKSFLDKAASNALSQKSKRHRAVYYENGLRATGRDTTTGMGATTSAENGNVASGEETPSSVYQQAGREVVVDQNPQKKLDVSNPEGFVSHWPVVVESFPRHFAGQHFSFEQILHNVKGMVCFPYSSSALFWAEMHALGIPLFIPSIELLWQYHLEAQAIDRFRHVLGEKKFMGTPLDVNRIRTSLGLPGDLNLAENLHGTHEGYNFADLERAFPNLEDEGNDTTAAQVEREAKTVPDDSRSENTKDGHARYPFVRTLIANEVLATMHPAGNTTVGFDRRVPEGRILGLAPDEHPRSHANCTRFCPEEADMAPWRMFESKRAFFYWMGKADVYHWGSHVRVFHNVSHLFSMVRDHEFLDAVRRVQLRRSKRMAARGIQVFETAIEEILEE
ncbi:unnamed protein product [Amoebophrya sp. A25]|nr:unnamed protein product [Amoebophrya sp. A25]|eukprot:GSA25T00009988001.1